MQRKWLDCLAEKRFSSGMGMEMEMKLRRTDYVFLFPLYEITSSVPSSLNIDESHIAFAPHTINFDELVFPSVRTFPVSNGTTTSTKSKVSTRFVNHGQHDRHHDVEIQQLSCAKWGRQRDTRGTHTLMCNYRYRTTTRTGVGSID